MTKLLSVSQTSKNRARKDVSDLERARNYAAALKTHYGKSPVTHGGTSQTLTELAFKDDQGCRHSRRRDRSIRISC